MKVWPGDSINMSEDIQQHYTLLGRIYNINRQLKSAKQREEERDSVRERERFLFEL